MPDNPIQLTPDDEQPRPVLFEDDQPEQWQPYAYVAIYAALLLMLGLRLVADKLFFNRQLIFLMRVNFAVICALAVYLTLTILRPRINLLLTSVVGAILGAWYGLPAQLIYRDAWHDPRHFASLVLYTVMAGVAGLFIGRAFGVEREPKLVVPISFLSVFVIANLYSIILQFVSK